MNYVNYDKVDLQYFFIIFFTYIKMSKNSLAKYYQENRDYKKKLIKAAISLWTM